MTPGGNFPLRALAEVIVQVGVNLQPGQPLFITEPYGLQGVHPETAPLIEAIRAAIEPRSASTPIEVVMADPVHLRGLAEGNDLAGYEALVSGHVARMQHHLARGGAFLFLLGSQPQLLAGLPAETLTAFARVQWRHLGPLIQRLVRGATQWTLAPAPSSSWAAAVYPDLAAAQQLPALWRTVAEAMRLNGWSPAAGQVQDTSDGRTPPVTRWSAHLAALARRREELNAARHHRIRFSGPGTDLTLDLPRSHVWCTAQLISRAGVPFVTNLPTEEVFTAPHKNSAQGKMRVARPVVHGGAVIDGIELEFRQGQVVAATAQVGREVLQHLLATDQGAARLGEVAVVGAALRRDRGHGLGGARPPPAVPSVPSWQTSGRLFHHPLLDENAMHHVALGEAYPFCSRALLPLALNQSQIHLDLPLDAAIELI